MHWLLYYVDNKGLHFINRCILHQRSSTSKILNIYTLYITSTHPHWRVWMGHFHENILLIPCQAAVAWRACSPPLELSGVISQELWDGGCYHMKTLEIRVSHIYRVTANLSSRMNRLREEKFTNLTWNFLDRLFEPRFVELCLMDLKRMK